MAAVGWKFQDQSLMDIVRQGDGPEFQRLEFVGDAVAQAVVAPWIYRWSAGSVAVITRAWEYLLGDHNLDYLATLTGVRDLLAPDAAAIPERPGDAVEALVGAAYIDGGWSAATAVCEALVGEWLARPDGVTVSAARIDTSTREVTPGNWECRYEVWKSRRKAVHTGAGVGADRLAAELAAVTEALAGLDRAVRYIWLEAGDELRAALADPAAVAGGAAAAILALLAAHEGVWYLPSGTVCLDDGPSDDDRYGDGSFTAFETLLGLDLTRNELERFATRPSEERRRLTQVGSAVLKATAGIRAFDQAPDAREGALTAIRSRMLAKAGLNQMAVHTGLVGVSEPVGGPTSPHELVKSALGVVAVDDGPEAAVDLADRWLDLVDQGAPARKALTIITVTASSGDETLRVDLETQTAALSWELVDANTDWRVLALEGIAGAIDAIPPSDGSCPVMVVASSQLTELLNEDPGGRKTAIHRTVKRIRNRIDRRGLSVMCVSTPPYSPTRL